MKVYMHKVTKWNNSVCWIIVLVCRRSSRHSVLAGESRLSCFVEVMLCIITIYSWNWKYWFKTQKLPFLLYTTFRDETFFEMLRFYMPWTSKHFAAVHASKTLHIIGKLFAYQQNLSISVYFYSINLEEKYPSFFLMVA